MQKNLVNKEADYSGVLIINSLIEKITLFSKVIVSCMEIKL